LSEGEDDGEELLRRLVEFTIGLEVEVDIDEVGAGQKLYAVSFYHMLALLICIPGRPCQRK
jgi:hypothetical protein